MRAAEDWFIDNGVPHFLERYSAAERWRSLITPLLVLVAFELGMAPWSPPTLFHLLTAPPLVLAYVAMLRWQGGRSHETPRRWAHARALVWVMVYLCLMLGSGLVVGLYLNHVGLTLGLNNESVDGLTILLLLGASVVLLRPGVCAIPGRRARILLRTTIATVILFAAEGAIFPSFAELWSRFAPVGPEAIPQATPALLTAILIGITCLHASKSPGGFQGAPSAGALMVVPAVPLLLVVLAAETAIFPHTFVDPMVVGAGAMTAVCCAAVLGMARSRSADGEESRARGWRLGSAVVVTLLLVVSLASYPLLVMFYGHIYINPLETYVTGLDALLVASLVHLGYLALTVFVVSFGLDRLAIWAAREARHNLRNIGSGVTEGLPLLVVFITFFTFSQETWQVAHLASPAALTALLALLLATVLVVVLWTAATRVGAQVSFERARLEELAASAATGNAALSSLVDEWKGIAPRRDEHVVPLRGRSRLNAIAVLAMYEGLVLAPLTLLSAALLFLICKLTVKPRVAAGWIFGDGQERRGDIWKGALLPQPWLRVAVILAVFALLYVAVEVHRDHAQGSRFFAGAQTAMDQRLAMYLVYTSRRSAPLTSETGEPVPDRAPSTSGHQATSPPHQGCPLCSGPVPTR
ncbi:hypothetical protein ACI79C_04765 [Geodermatophilus sp. SYSU D00697]